ncbi:MAG: hypothetical protein ACFE7A_04815, partial [Promethearchaeota archaeon]
GGPEAALISYYPLNLDYVGKTIADVAKELNKDPSDTLFDLYKEYVHQRHDQNLCIVILSIVTVLLALFIVRYLSACVPECLEPVTGESTSESSKPNDPAEPAE